MNTFDQISDKDVRDAIELDIRAAEKALRFYLISVRRSPRNKLPWKMEVEMKNDIERAKRELEAWDAAHPQQSSKFSVIDMPPLNELAVSDLVRLSKEFQGHQLQMIQTELENRGTEEAKS